MTMVFEKFDLLSISKFQDRAVLALLVPIGCLRKTKQKQMFTGTGERSFDPADQVDQWSDKTADCEVEDWPGRPTEAFRLSRKREQSKRRDDKTDQRPNGWP